MTIDRESLRPAFERIFPVPEGVQWDPAASKYRSDGLPVDCAIQQSFWEGFCAAFESLGEPVAWMATYVSPDGRDHTYTTPNKPSDRGDWRGQPVPLYLLPEVKA